MWMSAFIILMVVSRPRDYKNITYLNQLVTPRYELKCLTTRSVRDTEHSMEIAMELSRSEGDRCTYFCPTTSQYTNSCRCYWRWAYTLLTLATYLRWILVCARLVCGTLHSRIILLMYQQVSENQ